METYILILRGINVGGHKAIKMDALRVMLEDLDFKNVKTYIQSGNVVFQMEKAECRDLETKIEKKIASTFHFDVPVLVKRQIEVVNILKQNPFVNERDEAIEWLHVTFLSNIPEQQFVEKIKDLSTPPDEFILSETAIYLFCPKGYGNSKLSNTFFENKLKVMATTRNWRTVNELVRMAESLASN